jgi:hypothetical protein
LLLPDGNTLHSTPQKICHKKIAVTVANELPAMERRLPLAEDGGARLTVQIQEKQG